TVPDDEDPDKRRPDDPALQDLQAAAKRREQELLGMLALRIETAAMLDRAMRLEDKLGAVRNDKSQSIVERLRKLASGIRRARPSGTDRQERAAGRCAAVILKSGLFDSEYYLRRNPDVARTGVEPVMHYVQRGAAELRSPGPFFSTRWYTNRYPDVLKSG